MCYNNGKLNVVRVQSTTQPNRTNRANEQFILDDAPGWRLSLSPYITYSLHIKHLNEFNLMNYNGFLVPTSVDFETDC